MPEVVDAALRLDTTGPKAKRFEAEFAGLLGDLSLQAIAVNSATAGLHRARGARHRSGDEVITTTHTFTATAEVVRYLGADVVLVDIDPATLNIDPTQSSARSRRVPGRRAGSLRGWPPTCRRCWRAGRRGLKVVEDVARTRCTTSGGALVGTLASPTPRVFSFYANKTITTGEGGMVVARDDERQAHQGDACTA